MGLSLRTTLGQPSRLQCGPYSRTNGATRVLTKAVSAEVEITLRADGPSGPTAKPRPVPMETFATTKEMGRILIRRGGETIGAGAFSLLCRTMVTPLTILQALCFKYSPESIRAQDHIFHAAKNSRV